MSPAPGQGEQLRASRGSFRTGAIANPPPSPARGCTDTPGSGGLPGDGRVLVVSSMSCPDCDRARRQVRGWGRLSRGVQYAGHKIRLVPTTSIAAGDILVPVVNLRDMFHQVAVTAFHPRRPLLRLHPLGLASQATVRLATGSPDARASCPIRQAEPPLHPAEVAVLHRRRLRPCRRCPAATLPPGPANRTSWRRPSFPT